MALPAAQIGWHELTDYYNQVFLYLMEMKTGSQFRVTDRVRPENYELFLHCACTAIRELEYMNMGVYYIEYIEGYGTVILKR